MLLRQTGFFFSLFLDEFPKTGKSSFLESFACARKKNGVERWILELVYIMTSRNFLSPGMTLHELGGKLGDERPCGKVWSVTGVVCVCVEYFLVSLFFQASSFTHTWGRGEKAANFFFLFSARKLHLLQICWLNLVANFCSTHSWVWNVCKICTAKVISKLAGFFFCCRCNFGQTGLAFPN